MASKSKSKSRRGLPCVASYKGKTYSLWFRKRLYTGSSQKAVLAQLPDSCKRQWAQAALTKARKAAS